MVELPIPVPTRLQRVHPLVEATREAYRQIKPTADGRLEMRPRRGIVRLAVSKAQVDRALRVLQAIVAEAYRRDWTVEPVDRSYGNPAGVGIVVDGHSYSVKITELTDRVRLTDDEIERWRRDYPWKEKWGEDPPTHRPVANGRLKLSLPSPYGSGRRSNWSDGARASVEDKLGSIFRELDARADEDARRAEERARREVELEREKEEQQRRARANRVDQARAVRLGSEVEAWRLTREVRAYADALSVRLPDHDESERNRLSEWCAWARDWADRNDPITNTRVIVGFDDERDALGGSQAIGLA